MPPDHQSYCYAEESYRQDIELAGLSWAMCSVTSKGWTFMQIAKSDKVSAFIDNYCPPLKRIDSASKSESLVPSCGKPCVQGTMSNLNQQDMTETSVFRRFAIESSIDRRVFFSLHALLAGSARGSIAKALGVTRHTIRLTLLLLARGYCL